MTTSTQSNAANLLVPSDVDFYREQGYLVLRSVFSTIEVQQLADDVERVMRADPSRIVATNMRVRFKPHVVTNESLFEVFDPIGDLSPVANSIARDQRILSVLHELYGEPAELFKDKFIYKPPGATGATLHQDWIGWPGFPESFLTVLLAVDPFTAESGATQVYPRLHQQGYLSPKDGKHHILSPESLDAEPVTLLLEPGDIAIFGCFTPHVSAPNLSNTCRRGYFISYNALSDGGDQYQSHYQEFHRWMLERTPVAARNQMFFR